MQTKDFGAEVDSTTNSMLYSAIYDILNSESDVEEFFGSHPISLGSKQMDLLLNEDYLVCEKSDGIRIMLLMYNKRVFLFDRKNVFYNTNIITTFPDCFLFDGEMYKEGENFIYAIFDTLIFNNKSYVDLNLLKRLHVAVEFTKSKIISSFRVPNNSIFHHFNIIVKQMMKSYGLFQVLDSIPSLKHENDGLIFTPVNEAYKLFQRSKILKWKPPHLNTVDFYIKASRTSNFYKLQCCFSANQGEAYGIRTSGTHLASIGTYFDENLTCDLEGKIGEFHFDADSYTVDETDFAIIKGAWVLHRIRTDKTSPNNISVVMNVIESAEDNMTEKFLRSAWAAIAKNYKERQIPIEQ